MVFAGGFTVGVQEWFDVLAHFELNNYGKNAKDLNLPHIPTYLKPWPSNLTADFIYTNPPCAPFSTASHGRQSTWSEDPRLSCFDDCFDLLFSHEPYALAIESVLAAWRKAPDYMRQKARIANSAGYATTIILHDGKYLGLPQTRRRMFLLMHKFELPWHSYKPKPVIACDAALKSPPVQYTIDDGYVHPSDHTKYLLLNKRPTDNTLVQVHDRMGFGRGKGSQRPVYTSSNCFAGRPAPTLLHCMHSHPTEPRYLTVREISRLCGFPDWWSWDLKVGPQTKASLIARGVTPTIAEWLAKFVYDSFDAAIPAKPKSQIADILKGNLVAYPL